MIERDFGNFEAGFGKSQVDEVSQPEFKVIDGEVSRRTGEATISQIRESLVKIERTPESPPKIQSQPAKTDWEPFNTEPTSEQRFINLYGGVYSAQMELNRIKAEGLIRVAAIEGNIVLTSLSASRTRSIEVNPDGSVTAKRRLFWGEKPVEDKENPYCKVTSIPEGWRIEICDQRILDELLEKFAGEKLQKKFVATFNQFLRAGIWQALRKEKLTSVKDKEIGLKYTVEGLIVGSAPIFALSGGYNIADVGFFPGFFIAHDLINIIVIVQKRGNRGRKTLNSLIDYFMPFVEIDRVLRGSAYLNLKGRNLVRLHQDSGETS